MVDTPGIYEIAAILSVAMVTTYLWVIMHDSFRKWRPSASHYEV